MAGACRSSANPDAGLAARATLLTGTGNRKHSICIY